MNMRYPVAVEPGSETTAWGVVVRLRVKPKYKFEDLLAQCDPDAELTQEDKQWVDAGPVGREVI